jgi:hypothetical protein
MTGIIRQMMILFLLLLAGFGANKLGFMNADFNKKFSAFVINVSTPAMILSSVMDTEQLLSQGEIFLLLGLSLGTFLLAILIAPLVPKLLRADQREGDILRFMTIFSNVAFMGFPVISALMGESAIFYASIFGMPFNILVYSYGVRLVSGGREGGFDKKTLLSPCILASVLAMVIYLSAIPVPEVLVSALDYLADITVPGAMLIIGSSLALMPLSSVFRGWRIYALCFIKLLVLPICLYGILQLLPISDTIIQVTVIMWSMPVATNCTMLATQYGGDQNLASKGVLLTTLFSIVTIPLLMRLLFL